MERANYRSGVAGMHPGALRKEIGVIQQIKRWAMALTVIPFLAFAAGPDMRLKDVDGKERNVNEFIGRGKWTVVAVWSADCPICRRDIYHMTFFYDEHKKDTAVLGLSVDGYGDRAKARAFIEEQSLNFPNLIGEPEDAARLSRTAFIGTPTYYFFSPEGKFLTHRIGPVTQQQAEEILRDLKNKPMPGKG